MNDMNMNYKTMNGEWSDFADAPPTLRPAPSPTARATQEKAFEKLKGRLLKRELAEAATPDLAPPLQRAANDAAALAWETALPLLVFPVLFEEITAAAMHRSHRQSRVWAGSELVAA